MKDSLQQDILDKKIDLTKDLADKFNKALETDDAPPMGSDIVKNRQKLEAAVSYIAESNLQHAAEIEKYIACDEDNTAANLIIMTGAELRGKPVYDALSNIPQIGPALGKVFGGIFGVEGAYDALGHIEEHNKECSLKKILDQPNSEEITHEKLCQETQKQAKENPLGLPKPTILPSWSVPTESKVTSISRDIPAHKKTIALPIDLPPERPIQTLNHSEIQPEPTPLLPSVSTALEPKVPQAPVSVPEPRLVQARPNFHRAQQAAFVQKVFSQSQPQFTPKGPVSRAMPPPAYSNAILPGFNAHRGNVSYVLRLTQDPVMRSAQRHSSFGFKF